MPARSLSLQQYKEGIIANDPAILGKAITLVESRLDIDRQLAASLIKDLLPKTGKAKRVAVSGVPGAGKSTFIEALGKHLTGSGQNVAVLAIDPTSVKTKGSILGDKTRMEELSKDPQAFVRPSPAAGHSGGVAGRTREAILLCEAAGYKVVIIETVGVGQSEIAVRSMVDYFLLLMIAGAGDELQGIKKGILEMADGIAINKSDGDNVKQAMRARSDLQHALHLLSRPKEEQTPVVVCSALMRTGVAEIWDTITAFFDRQSETGALSRRRMEQNYQWMEERLREMMLEEFDSGQLSSRKSALEVRVRDGTAYPPDAARELWNEVIKSRK